MKSNLHMIAYVLVILGGINWGLAGVFNFNLISILGLPQGVEKLVYVATAMAAAYEIFTHQQNCALCANTMSSTSVSVISKKKKSAQK